MLARFNRNYVPVYRDDFFNDRVFRSFNGGTSNVTSPAVNIIETENEFNIEVAVPGLSRNDFKIEVENDLLTISSEQKEQKDEKKDSYTRREFSFNSFKRSFQLPEIVDQDKILARHEAGIVSIQLPKKEEVLQKAPKQIKVK